MQQGLHVITLVDDLERALVFYRDGLGLKTEGIIATDLVDPRTGAKLAKDAEIAAAMAQSGQFSLGQLVASRDEVDKVLAQAARAGAIVTPANDRPWGIYFGYFRDPDGHLWEIIHNPG